MKTRIAILLVLFGILILVAAKNYKYYFLLQAIRYENAERHLDAAKEYEKLLLLSKPDHQLFFSIANAYAAAEKFGKAVHYFQKCVASPHLNQEEQFQYNFLLGSALYRNKEYSRAVERFRQLNQLKPSAVVYTMLTRILRETGALNESLQVGTQGSELYPSDYHLRLHVVATMMALQQLDAAEKTLLEYTDLMKGSPMLGHVYNTLGNLYSMKRRWSEAEAWLEKALQEDPDSVEFKYELGTMYYNSGRFDLAEKTFRPLLDEKLPFYPDLLFVMGRMYYHSDHPKIALQYFEKYSQHTKTNLDYIESMIMELRLRMSEKAQLSKRLAVEFRSEKNRYDAVYLAGNWEADGGYRFLPGWQRHAMTKQKTATKDFDVWSWVGTVKPHRDFPMDIVIDDDTNPDNGVLAYRTASLLAEGDSFTLQMDAENPAFRIDQPPVPGEFRDTKEFVTAAGGRKRVFVMWLDSGSWPILSRMLERGLLPNIRKIIRGGVAANMFSPHPHTALALKVLTYFPENQRESLFTIFANSLMQLKSLRMFERMLAAVNEETLNYFSPTIQTSLWQVLGENKKTYLNFIFSDYAVFDPQDSLADVAVDASFSKPKLDNISAKERREAYRYLVELDKPGGTVDKTLDQAIDKPNEFDTNLLTNYFTTLEKYRLLRETLAKSSYDFALVRFPECDLISHKFWNLQAVMRYEPQSKEFLLQPSAYRFVLERFYQLYDAIVGAWMGQLAVNDTFLLISDHGARNVFDHDVNSLFLAHGPSIKREVTINHVNMVQFPGTILRILDIPTKVAGKDYPFMQTIFQ